MKLKTLIETVASFSKEMSDTIFSSLSFTGGNSLLANVVNGTTENEEEFLKLASLAHKVVAVKKRPTRTSVLKLRRQEPSRDKATKAGVAALKDLGITEEYMELAAESMFNNRLSSYENAEKEMTSNLSNINTILDKAYAQPKAASLTFLDKLPTSMENDLRTKVYEKLDKRYGLVTVLTSTGSMDVEKGIQEIKAIRTWKKANPLQLVA